MSPDVSASAEDQVPFAGEGDDVGKERDGARSLRDLQEESGDEDEIDDLYAIDRREAHEAGVELDRADGPEAVLS